MTGLVGAQVTPSRDYGSPRAGRAAADAFPFKNVALWKDQPSGSLASRRRYSGWPHGGEPSRSRIFRASSRDVAMGRQIACGTE